MDIKSSKVLRKKDYILKQCSGDLIFFQKQLVYSVMEKINITQFVLLPVLDSV